jgi:DNA-binding transcriptional MerR regulator
MSDYRNSDVQALFGVSSETVRAWSEEFSEYLSPTATPGTGKHRVFSDEDLRVFAYISSARASGMDTDEIHAGLRSGQRGDVPTVLDTRSMEIGVNLQLSIARRQIDDLQQELEISRSRESELQHKLIRAETRLEETEKNTEQRLSELRIALEQSREGRDGLLRQIAKLEVLLEIAEKQNKDE